MIKNGEMNIKLMFVFVVFDFRSVILAKRKFERKCTSTKKKYIFEKLVFDCELIDKFIEKMFQMYQRIHRKPAKQSLK